MVALSIANLIKNRVVKEAPACKRYRNVFRLTNSNHHLIKLDSIHFGRTFLLSRRRTETYTYITGLGIGLSLETLPNSVLYSIFHGTAG